MNFKLRKVRSVACMVMLLTVVFTSVFGVQNVMAATYSKAGGTIVYSNVNDLKTAVTQKSMEKIMADTAHNVESCSSSFSNITVRMNNTVGKFRI